MANTNIKLFDENKSNMMSDIDYGKDTQRANGVQTGLASSQLQNKFQYQMSLMAYAVAQLMIANGYDAMDSAAVSTFVGNFSDSVVQKVKDKASASEAAAGTNDLKWVSAKQLVDVATSIANKATEGMVKYNTPQTLTDAQKQQARDNINAPAPYEAGDNIAITGRIITTKAFPCNPNLLDNWYFGNPVDQRNGYIVNNGANLYTDATCTTVAATVSGGPYQAYPISSICVSFTTNATYYCKIGDAGVVRGYTAIWGYTIDRWKISPDSIVSISGGGLSVIKNVYQPLLSADLILGQKYTMSALLTDGRLGQLTFTLSQDINITHVFDFGMFIINRDNLDTYWFGLNCPNEEICLAIKLELGSQQTLAHQENGKWVLNEIPDYGEQLRECQRYCVAFNMYDSFLPMDNTDFVVELPVPMRAKPTITNSKNIINANVTKPTVAWYNIGSNQLRLRSTASHGGLSAVCNGPVLFSADL